MEPMEGCRETFTMTELFQRLTDLYRCFDTGSRPSQRAADVAEVIFSGVCGRVPGGDIESAPAESCCGSSAELTCISATLVDMMCCPHSQDPEVQAFCAEVLRLLVHMDLMSQLVHHFHSEDQIVSHLAAKSVSACVVHYLITSGTVSPLWQQKCEQAFHSSAPGPELDSCLWSLTEVLKKLLKAAHQDILGTLLAALDSSLSALCSRFLPEERGAVTFSSSKHWGITFCLLLDLLEALTASGLMCGSSLRSQRLTHIHSPALLTAISCSSEYYVKKRVLLLLKRAVLQTAGEDWTLGEVLSVGLKNEHLSSDMSMLAQTVLTAVSTNWLQSVQVQSASFFGGTRQIRGGESQKPDCVMMRAVSLLLLKSLELHIQTAGRTGVATEVSEYLQSLWDFLQCCSIQLTQVTHRCCWITLLFTEQDDDMMEAAKALFSIFLHHRRSSGLDDFSASEAACTSGCNPHCHFLSLLQSVSFDHSILLDFLISTETCFLEYFVRYLKYLRADWQGFTIACRKAGVSDCHCSLRESNTRSCGVNKSPLTRKGEYSSCVQPTGVTPQAETIGLVTGLRLVEYDNSDESDPESMEITEDEPRTSARVESKSSASDVKQEPSGPLVFTKQKQYESSDSAGLLSDTNFSLERKPAGISLPVLQNKQTFCTNKAPVSGRVTCGSLTRAALCLSELREVVMRLQTKNLFPYNPSSLLKLLAEVEMCSKQSLLSHCNK